MAFTAPRCIMAAAAPTAVTHLQLDSSSGAGTVLLSPGSRDAVCLQMP